MTKKDRFLFKLYLTNDEERLKSEPKTSKKQIEFRFAGFTPTNDFVSLIANSFINIITFHCIRFSSNQIDVLCDMIKKSETLTEFAVSSCNLPNDLCLKIAESLRTNSLIKKLNFEENYFGCSGAKIISEILAKNDVLKCINLGCNGINDEGGKALGKALEKNTSLVELNLWGNEFGSLTANAFKLAFSKNQKIALRFLTLNNWTNLTSSDTKDISLFYNCRSLEYLNIYGSRESEIFTHLFKCDKSEFSGSSITDLIIRYNDVREFFGGILKFVSNSNMLKTLDFKSCYFITSEIENLCNVIKLSSNLERLKFGCHSENKGYGKIIGELIKNNKSLRHLGFSRNSHGSEGEEYFIAAALSSNKTLKELDLYHNKTGNSFLRAIGNSFDTGECGIEILNIGSNEESGEHAAFFYSSICNSKLKKLIFRGIKFDKSSIVSFQEMLKNEKCPLEDVEFGSARHENGHFIAIIKALETNTSISKISFGNVKNNDSSAECALARLFSLNCVISDISVGFDKNTCNGTKKMLRALCFNVSIVKLDISSKENEIMSFVDLISRIFIYNKSLADLRFDLNENCDSKGLVRLLESLPENKYLDHLKLYIGDHSITFNPQETEDIKSSLKANTSLTFF